MVIRLLHLILFAEKILPLRFFLRRLSTLALLKSACSLSFCRIIVACQLPNMITTRIAAILSPTRVVMSIEMDA
ncbi:hypothetical protein DA11_18005 [Aeromonas caviae]|nr:hypothetical protein DA11_18005 [Aeromonas caviae]